MTVNALSGEKYLKHVLTRPRKPNIHFADQITYRKALDLFWIFRFFMFYININVSHTCVCASCVQKHHKRPDRLTQYIQVNNTHTHRQLKNQLKRQWGSGKTEKKSRKWKNSKSPQLIKCGGFGSRFAYTIHETTITTRNTENLQANRMDGDDVGMWAKMCSPFARFIKPFSVSNVLRHQKFLIESGNKKDNFTIFFLGELAIEYECRYHSICCGSCVWVWVSVCFNLFLKINCSCCCCCCSSAAWLYTINIYQDTLTHIHRNDRTMGKMNGMELSSRQCRCDDNDWQRRRQ